MLKVSLKIPVIPVFLEKIAVVVHSRGKARETGVQNHTGYIRWEKRDKENKDYRKYRDQPKSAAGSDFQKEYLPENE